MSAYAVSTTGTVTRYAGCRRIYHNDDGTHDFYTGLKNQGGGFIARIPAGYIVTFDKPGVETKGVSDPITAEIALDIVSRSIRSFKPGGRWGVGFNRLKTIKDALRDFDARSGEWKS